MKSQLLIASLGFFVVTTSETLHAQKPHAHPHGAASREKVAPVVAHRAYGFALEDVTLLDGPFKTAMETNKAYLLRLEPDRLLSFMRKNAGLQPKAAGYEGWDKGGSGTVGHYLSALALASQATGDRELRRRLDYLVGEMAEYQKASGQGGLYAFEWDAREYFPKMAQGEVVKVTFVNAWYSTHKTLAGLRDAYALTGNEQAREVLIRFVDWCDAVTSKLDEAEWVEMLWGEHGGPHEIFADVYAYTGERKYLQLAEKFRHKKFFDPMARNEESVLNGEHANSQVPKFIAYQRIYELGGEPVNGTVARNFYHNVVNRRSWVTGGNSQWERFFAHDKWRDNLDEVCGPETCNTYNMLKMTRQMYFLAPTVADVDFYERALYNHILPSISPLGGYNYYTSMRPGHYRVFSRDFDAFWCCVGTGIENHSKYGEMIYAHTDNRLFVNLFIASQLKWQEKGITLRQETHFPEAPNTKFTVQTAKPQPFTLTVRYPNWVAPNALQVLVNGKTQKLTAKPGQWIDIARTWKNNDRIEVRLPMTLQSETLPNDSGYAALLYGPIVLAGKLDNAGLKQEDFFGGGPFESPGQTALKTISMNAVPVWVGDSTRIAKSSIVPTNEPLTFQTRGLFKPQDVTLVPLYKLHFSRTAIYWPVQNPAQYAQNQAAIADLQARTIDRVLIGESASETAHNFAQLNSRSGAVTGDYSHWRDAPDGWFAYDVKVFPNSAQEIAATYWGDDAGNRRFDILVDGQKIAQQTVERNAPGRHFTVAYSIPAALIAGKSKVTVRFQAQAGANAGGLYDLRVMKSK